MPLFIPNQVVKHGRGARITCWCLCILQFITICKARTPLIQRRLTAVLKVLQLHARDVLNCSGYFSFTPGRFQTHPWQVSWSMFDAWAPWLAPGPSATKIHVILGRVFNILLQYSWRKYLRDQLFKGRKLELQILSRIMKTTVSAYLFIRRDQPRNEYMGNMESDWLVGVFFHLTVLYFGLLQIKLLSFCT